MSKFKLSPSGRVSLERAKALAVQQPDVTEQSPSEVLALVEDAFLSCLEQGAEPPEEFTISVGGVLGTIRTAGYVVHVVPES